VIQRIAPGAWALEGGQGVLTPLDFENFSKKGCFLSFDWEKSNFTTFGSLPRKILKKIPQCHPPGKDSSDAHDQGNLFLLLGMNVFYD